MNGLSASLSSNACFHRGTRSGERMRKKEEGKAPRQLAGIAGPANYRGELVHWEERASPRGPASLLLVFPNTIFRPAIHWLSVIQTCGRGKRGTRVFATEWTTLKRIFCLAFLNDAILSTKVLIHFWYFIYSFLDLNLFPSKYEIGVNFSSLSVIQVLLEKIHWSYLYTKTWLKFLTCIYNPQSQCNGTHLEQKNIFH